MAKVCSLVFHEMVLILCLYKNRIIDTNSSTILFIHINNSNTYIIFIMIPNNIIV